MFLHSLLAAGTSISVPAKPYVGLLASAAQLALASTLVVYPPITTKATSTEALKGSDAALRYLHCVRETVDAPGYKTMRTAFVFSDSRRRGHGLGSAPSSPSSAHGHDVEQLNDVAANRMSLWRRAVDFWHVVGWAFNCSVVHKKRWARWKLWLNVTLSLLEADCDDCTMLQETLIWRYITSQEPLAGNTRKRMFRAILATADSLSLKDFPEVWDKEAAEPKEKDSQRKRTGPIDFNTGDIGDYESEDENVEMQDAPQPTSKRGRPRKNASRPSETTLPPLEEAFIPDYEAAVARLGGTDAIDLRQRLIVLVRPSPSPMIAR